MTRAGMAPETGAIFGVSNTGRIFGGSSFASTSLGLGISLGTISLGASNLASGNNLVNFGLDLTIFSGTRSGRGIISVTVNFPQMPMRSGQTKRDTKRHNTRNRQMP